MIEPNVTITDRGFKRLDQVPSDYGGGVWVYESSAASQAHIWVRIECPKDLNNPNNGEKVEAHAHLTLDNAQTLSDQLAWLVKNHYQVDPVNCQSNCEVVPENFKWCRGPVDHPGDHFWIESLDRSDGTPARTFSLIEQTDSQ